MRDKLYKLLENSYSPYSKYRVSAILITKDGREFNGVNIENASYGGSICAERTAILTAVATGLRKGDFKELYVMCDGNTIGMPCSICRQTFVEFFEKDMKVIAMNPNGKEEIHTVAELCPFPFSSEDL